MDWRAWLLGDLFSVLGQSVTPLEALAFLTGLAAVWLTVKVDVLNWPFGLVSVACYSVLFIEARLYAVALLQGFFFAFGVYGWRRWTRVARGEPGGVTRAPTAERTAAALAGAAGTVAVAAWLAWATDSAAPVFDAGILVMSLIAVWWQARKRIETWPLWMAVDAISIPLYWIRGLSLTSVLYVLFLALCVAGLREWRSRLVP